MDGDKFEQFESANELLLEMVRNQKDNMRNTIKIYVITVVCYTLILITLIIGFLFYESQFVTETKVETAMETILTTEGENASINNVSNGDMYNNNVIRNK